jgi:hypothetical protein
VSILPVLPSFGLAEKNKLSDKLGRGFFSEKKSEMSLFDGEGRWGTVEKNTELWLCYSESQSRLKRFVRFTVVMSPASPLFFRIHAFTGIEDFSTSMHACGRQMHECDRSSPKWYF